MAHKVYMEAVKSNKEKDDHATGLPIPQVKGTAVFEVPLTEASIYDKKEAYILTGEEYERLSGNCPSITNQELWEQFDTIQSAVLVVGGILKKRAEGE